MFTFSQFLLNEDLSAEIAQLQTQISQLVAKKNQQVGPIDKQVQTLQALLAAKQKQLNVQQSTAVKKEPMQPAAKTGTV